MDDTVGQRPGELQNGTAKKPDTSSSMEEKKEGLIRSAYANQDIQALTALAHTNGGLLNDSLRRLAWPLLLGVYPSEITSDQAAAEHLPPHPDEAQVQLDVDRSFVYYPQNDSEAVLTQRRKDLQNIISWTLRKHRWLCYPQGYHDIVQVLLLVLGREQAMPAVARLTLLRVRDFMLPTISATVDHLKLLPPLLKAADGSLERHIAPNDPSYALAATMTLYAHHVERYPDVARIYDFLLASEAVMPIYLFASMVISRKAELFEIEPGEPEMLSVLQKLPDSVDWESLIAQAKELFARYPPERLPGRPWRNVSSYSVLNTTRGPFGITRQTLDDGAHWFAKHAAQVRMHQRLNSWRLQLWKMRTNRTTLGAAAILVALLAWSLRNDEAAGMLTTLWHRFKLLMW